MPHRTTAGLPATLAGGAAAGAAATGAMSAVMLGAQRAGLMGEMPPRTVTRAAIDAAGAGEFVGDTATDVLAVGAHFGFGAAAGALFAVLHSALRVPMPAVAQGVAFGTLVWTVSYVGWVPALRIMPMPQDDRPGRPESMVVAHWVYGAVLGALVGALHRR